MQHFTSGSEVVLNPNGYQTVASNTISLTETNTVATMPQVTLKAPGDYVEFKFDVINEGDITGYINTINNISLGTPSYGSGEDLTSDEKAAFEAAITATLTYDDQNKTALAVNNSIAKNERKNLILTIRFNNTAEVQKLPKVAVTYSNITASIIYGQDQVSQGGNGGNEPVVTNPYLTTFNGTYGYDYDGAETSGNGGSSEWVSALDPNVTIYMRNDGSKNEVCGVFGSGQAGTVCLAGAGTIADYSTAGNYESDFEDVSEDTYDITTAAGLSATGLKGYSLSKAEEMLNNGASSCGVGGGSAGCSMPSGGGCHINSSGDVGCSGNSDWNLNSDGGASFGGH